MADKKPKQKKYPKAPKPSASLETFKAYETKCAEVTTKNTEALSKYNATKKKKKTILEGVKKKKESVRALASKTI